jgi:hypothetical protein
MPSIGISTNYVTVVGRLVKMTEEPADPMTPNRQIRKKILPSLTTQCCSWLTPPYNEDQLYLQNTATAGEVQIKRSN